MTAIGKMTAWRTGLALLVILMSITPAAAAADKEVTYKGTIQGILCVHDKSFCHGKNRDMYMAQEPDFVLLLPDRRYFLLPNVDRLVKSKYLGMNVRVSGVQKSESIWVTTLDVKEGGQYRQVWSWEQLQKMYIKSGGGD